MLLPFIVAALLLGFEDICELKKLGGKKDMLIYTILMIAAIAVCLWFSMSSYNHSLADMIMGIFNIQG